VLAAAADLLGRQGYQAFRMDDLARAAGTTTTAIYRRWPGRTAVLLDVLADRLPAPEPIPETGDVTADLMLTAGRLAESLNDPVVRNGLTGLIAHAAADAEIAAQFRRRLIEPQLAAAASGVAAARADGRAPEWLNVELLADVIAGTVLQRIIVRGGRADSAFLAELAALLVAAMRP
jgi:AcrR family transcriptional regulator